MTTPPRTPDFVPTSSRTSSQHPSRANASDFVPSPPVSPIGDEVSEPAPLRPAHFVPTPSTKSQFNPGTTWLITDRTRPAWTAALDLLDDNQWHHRSDVAQAMRGAADLADRTIATHLRSASRRGWITKRGDRIRLRNRNTIEQALSTGDQSPGASRVGALGQLEDLVEAGAVRLCRQSGPVSEETADVVVRFAETLRARAAGDPVCRVCGCTDERACPPTCWWVEPDLCSSCGGAR